MKIGRRASIYTPPGGGSEGRLGRVGASGSDDADWHHHDGAGKHREGEAPEKAGT